MQFLISIIIAGGAALWAYNYQMRTTGNNTKSALILAGIVGGFVFIVLFLLVLRLLPN